MARRFCAKAGQFVIAGAISMDGLSAGSAVAT